MTEIKICGLSSPETIDAAIAGGASHIGFVHFPKSPRHVSLAQIVQLGQGAQSVTRVAVTVDPDDALLSALSGTRVIDAVQIHKVTSVERLAAIKARFDFELWNAVAVENAENLKLARPMISIADVTLYDAKTPRGSDLPGGMGVSFDWNLLSGIAHPRNWAVSGGLDPDNVAQAINTTGAPMVDVSSGVESHPGVKDVDKIARFCEAVQRL